MTMLRIDELKNGLDLGEYGEYLNDYRDSQTCICDAIEEIADNNTSIYYCDIIRYISENVEKVNDAIKEYGWNGCGGDLYKAGQIAQYGEISEDLNNHLSDALKLCAYDFIIYDLGVGCIPEDLANLVGKLVDSADTGDKLDEIPDTIRKYFANAKKEA